MEAAGRMKLAEGAAVSSDLAPLSAARSHPPFVVAEYTDFAPAGIMRSTSNWSAAQQLAQHTSCACPMRVGELLGSGTISGPAPASQEILLELSANGTQPVPVAGGAVRSFIEDNDRIVPRGCARGEGFSIGFGDCAGKPPQAPPDPYAR